MRDVDFPPDADVPELRPDDPEEQNLYIQRFRGRYAKEIAGLDPSWVTENVRENLKLCPPLRIRDPRDVLRFLELKMLVAPAQAQSPFLQTVTRRVLEAVDDWSATKRLDFIFKHVVGRTAPVPEPDFGPWFDGIPAPV